MTIAEAFRKDSSLTATVYKMRPKTSGRRAILADGTIEFFQQGKTDRAGAYPGDQFFKQDDNLSIQLHSYDLGPKTGSNVVGKAAPLVAFYVPPALARNWLIQVQREQN